MLYILCFLCLGLSLGLAVYCSIYENPKFNPKPKNFVNSLVAGFIAFVLFVLGVYFYHSAQAASGFHLIWSSNNFRWIWVDENGHP